MRGRRPGSAILGGGAIGLAAGIGFGFLAGSFFSFVLVGFFAGLLVGVVKEFLGSFSDRLR